MSYSIATLLTRNLHDVFGESRNPRNWAMAGGSNGCRAAPATCPPYAGSDFIIARDGQIAAVYLFFDRLP